MGNGDSQELRRDALSTPDLLIAGMSYMAPGFSLFFTTAVIASVAGIYIPLMYLFAGLGVLCTGTALAEFARISPSAGSLQTFIAKGFGRVPSIAGGLVLMCGYLFLQSAVAALFGGWTSTLLDEIGISISWQILTVIGVLAFMALMIRGVQVSIRATWILFLIEFVIILAISIVVLVSGGDNGLSAEPINLALPDIDGIQALALGMVFATFSFVGFEGSVSFAEETPNPKRALPIAVIGGVVAMVLLYILAGYASVIGFGVDNVNMLADDSEPIATLASTFASPLEPFLKIAVLTSIAANLMAAGNANARILFNMGRERAVPEALGAVHPRFKTPHVAVAAFMGATLIPCLIASNSWDYLTVFGNIAGLGALLALLIYMVAALALPAFLRHGQVKLKPFVHIVVPVIGAAVWLVPLWGSVKPGQIYPFNTYPWIALGLVVLGTIYAVARNRGGPPLATPEAGTAANPAATARAKAAEEPT